MSKTNMSTISAVEFSGFFFNPAQGKTIGKFEKRVESSTDHKCDWLPKRMSRSSDHSLCTEKTKSAALYNAFFASFEIQPDYLHLTF